MKLITEFLQLALSGFKNREKQHNEMLAFVSQAQWTLKGPYNLTTTSTTIPLFSTTTAATILLGSLGNENATKQWD